MKKVLLSWVATDNDFEQSTGEVSETKSPNFLMHKKFFDQYEKHFLVSSEAEIVPDKKMQALIAKLKKDFPQHPIEPIFANLKDINDAEEAIQKINQHVYPLLKGKEVDIYIAAGTTSIRLAWFLAHITWQDAITHLIQFKTPRNQRIEKVENLQIVSLDFSVSAVPVVAGIKQSLLENKSNKNTEPIITPTLMSIYKYAASVAQSDVRVIIYGETGAGKESLANYIHEHSLRKGKPFIAINCGAFSETLLESELFGYKKGAFTGADQDKEGLFEQANGGTLFLDEIGDISKKMQQNLLRVLQSGKVRRLQDNKEIPIDVRIIAATNKDLLQMCTEGAFRWDLYYRIAVIEIEIPPLRERGKQDIEQLLDAYMSDMASKYKRQKALQLAPQTKEYLLAYPYFGNVRELINIVENIYINHARFQRNSEIVLPDELPLKRMERIKQMHSNTSESELENAEKKIIQEKLLKNNGNRKKTAQELGISVNTLKDRIAKYNIKT
jgi:transcriptional regulator with PAS, ATPase and Fis domain